jgi:hypothetical protein
VNEAIRKALYAKLSGDATLAALLSGATAVYHAVAPEEAIYPLVVLHRQGGRKEETFGGEAWRDAPWLVKGVCQDGTSNPVDRIADRIDTLLDRGTLTIAGCRLVDASHQSDVEYVETVEGRQYRHAGSIYRLRVERTS